jgi:hypothetical protein
MTEICDRCRIESEKTYSCEHTNNTELCKECYQELHWELTNDPSVST